MLATVVAITVCPLHCCCTIRKDDFVTEKHWPQNLLIYFFFIIIVISIYSHFQFVLYFFIHLCDFLSLFAILLLLLQLNRTTNMSINFQ